MSTPELQLLLTAIILISGAGLFLRLVGKEKNRREQWLVFRLDEKYKELRQAEAQSNSEKIEAVPIGSALPPRADD